MTTVTVILCAVILAVMLLWIGEALTERLKRIERRVEAIADELLDGDEDA